MVLFCNEDIEAIKDTAMPVSSFAIVSVFEVMAYQLKHPFSITSSVKFTENESKMGSRSLG